jgi:hypothetical protein
MMDSGGALETGMFASLTAGVLIIAMEGIKDGSWDKMNARKGGGTGGPGELATAKVRAPSRV